MHGGWWTRGMAATGGVCLAAATWLGWGTPDERFTVIGVNINQTAPFLGPSVGDFLRGGPVLRVADAWHVAALSAVALVAAALLAAAVALTRLARSRVASAVAAVAVLAVAGLTVVTWINPPGVSLGPARIRHAGAGEPVALAGAALLLLALGARTQRRQTGAGEPAVPR